MPTKKTDAKPQDAPRAPRTRSRRAKSAGEFTGPSLVIVESPAKARTIGRFLGDAFEVRASMGHVRDLPVKGLGVDIDEEKGTFEPRYEVIPEKKKVVDELTKLALNAPKVYFATDLDREGEAIAWHLITALDVPEERRARVTFHEITRRAIDEAFQHPGVLDRGRVDAQQARRVLDRIVGYPLSRILSKGVSRGLSAGRVQSVALRLIVDREKAIRAFRAVDYWRVFADLRLPTASDDDKFTTDLVHVDEVADEQPWAEDAVVPEGTEEELAAEQAPAEGEAEGDAAEQPAGAREPKLGKSRELRLPRGEDAESLAEALRAPGTTWNVASIDARRRAESAPPPFITSTLQQQASIRFRWATKHAMKVAQELYEGVTIGGEGATGLITYMRTDSVSLAPEAIRECREFIEKTYDAPVGVNASVGASVAAHGFRHLPEKPNYFRSKKGAQEAHEAIRPTSVFRTPASVKRDLSRDQWMLYKLVWERFVACQMAPAQVDTTAVRVRAQSETRGAVFEARGRVTVFEGWRAVAGSREDKSAEPHLPVLSEGQDLSLVELRSEQRTTQPPPRYSEATLVKRLEKEGIGRPSTYAEIISKILARKYVTKEAARFHATELGEVVTDRLLPYFPDLMDLAFTRKMEEDLDAVEAGKEEWQAVLARFWGDFRKECEVADKGIVAEKFKPAEGVPPCEECGKPMVVRFSQGRKFYGCSGYPECKATRSGEDDQKKPAPIPTEHVCELCGKPMVIRQGRRGAFLACTGYPECRNTKDIQADGTVVATPTTTETCEKCGAAMVVRRGRRGPFLACSAYPACRNSRDVGAPPAAAGPGAAGAPAAAVGAAAPAEGSAPLPSVPLPPCPQCGAPTRLRRAKFWFCGCSRYPECKGTAPAPRDAIPKREPPKPAGVNCPDCGRPMVIRQSRRGPFAGCSGYPKCRGTLPMDQIPSGAAEPGLAT